MNLRRPWRIRTPDSGWDGEDRYRVGGDVGVGGGSSTSALRLAFICGVGWLHDVLHVSSEGQFGKMKAEH